MSFYDSICDNHNVVCCLACSVVLHTHSQRYAVRSGCQAHCRVFTDSVNAFNVYVMTSVLLLSLQNLLQRLQNLAVYVMNEIGFTFVLEAHLDKVIW